MKRKMALTILLILLIGLSACNLPGVQAPTNQNIPAGDQQPPPAASNTPEFTFTPSTSMVSVSVDTNYRTGPGTAYDIVGVLHVGETAEVVGQVSYGGSWIIKNPDGAGTCWLWDQYAIVTGDTQGLPVYDIPPTPTPMAGFTTNYVGLIACLPHYALRFEIKAVGAVNWQSIKIDIVDTTTATTLTHTSDTFQDRTCCPPCPLPTALQDLEPNETGFVVAADPGHFDYDPTGHNITITVTLYSLDGLAGESVTKTFTIIP